MAKKKFKRNISGLRNQPKRPPPPPPPTTTTQTQVDVGTENGSASGPSTVTDDANGQGLLPSNTEEKKSEEDRWKKIFALFELTKKAEEGKKMKGRRLEDSERTEVEVEVGRRELRPRKTPSTPTAQSIPEEPDEDWTPRKRQKLLKKDRPKTYAKGPDISLKAARTQRRYREARKGQTALTEFGIGVGVGGGEGDGVAEGEVCVLEDD